MKQKTSSGPMTMKSINGYESLANVLERAYDQAATGKGAERHARDLPFEEQPMQQLILLYGAGFAFGQAAKKAQESMRLPAGRDVAELLGAINYLAGAVIALERERQPVAGNDNEQPVDECPVCGGRNNYHHFKCTAAPGQFGVHDV